MWIFFSYPSIIRPLLSLFHFIFSFFRLLVRSRPLFLTTVTFCCHSHFAGLQPVADMPKFEFVKKRTTKTSSSSSSWSTATRSSSTPASKVTPSPDEVANDTKGVPNNELQTNGEGEAAPAAEPDATPAAEETPGDSTLVVEVRHRPA